MANSIWHKAFGAFVLMMALLTGLPPVLHSATPVKIPILVIDGQNNHDWRVTTPILVKDLEETGLFRVAVVTVKKEEAPKFAPNFKSYKAVVLNYTDLFNGIEWPAATRQAFESWVRTGGGVIVFHAASSAFPTWRAFNEMTGLGGWGGRDERAGPYLYYKGGREIRDASPGPAGHHGQRHAFRVNIVDANHPITKGLPASWMHAKDELYDSLRGPAVNLTVLATAYSDPATGGTGRDEPVLFTVRYGAGRIFHTTLGHDAEAMNDPGFIATLQRGTEWAAIGQVTLPPPHQLSALASADQAAHPTSDSFSAATVGETLFQQKCGFCHGMDGSGAEGPDLLHSPLVVRDESGSQIGSVIREGRSGKGMPSFHLTDAQIKDIAAFLHAKIKAAATIFYTDSTSSYPVERLLVGDAKAGEEYFHGAGRCSTCHSATGDLAHIASKYKPFDLQTRILKPEGAPLKLTVTEADGRTRSGELLRLDPFFVSLRDSGGWTHTWPRGNVRVTVEDLLAEHRDMIPRYTDAEIHNLFAYLETLK